MVYQIHNGSRAVSTRSVRASNPSHKGLKLYIPIGQQRLVRGRPINVTEEQLLEKITELKDMAKQGLIYVTTTDGRMFDLDTREVLNTVASTPAVVQLPDDDANKDVNQGQRMSGYDTEQAPPKEFSMPVAPPSAAMDAPIVEEAPVQEEAPAQEAPVEDSIVEETTVEPSHSSRKKHKGGK